MTTTDSGFIRSLTNKYLRHLASVERMMETYNEKKEVQEPPEKDEELGSRVSYVVHTKFDAQRHYLNGENEKAEELLQELQENVEKSKLIKLIDSKVEVGLDENEVEIEIEIHSGLLRKAYKTYADSTLDSMYLDSQFRNSLIISLVIGLEVLIAEIFKDFVFNLDTSNEVIKDRKVSFEVLKDIGSVDDAKHFLVDQYIDKLLRDSFSNWLEEFNKKVKINISNNSWVKDDIPLINETIQRRHIIIHNDDIINNLYLNKIDPLLRNEREIGERLYTDENYILSRLSIFKKFGLILIYMYGCKKHPNNPDELFNEFHNSLVTLLEKDNEATRIIFKHWTRNEDLSPNTKGVCYVNYFLTFKLNNDDSIDQEIERFQPDDYGEDFEVIKSVLLKTSDAPEKMISFFQGKDDDDFIHSLTWPLMALIEKTDAFKEYVKSRVETIAFEGWEDDEHVESQ